MDKKQVPTKDDFWKYNITHTIDAWVRFVGHRHSRDEVEEVLSNICRREDSDMLYDAFIQPHVDSGDFIVMDEMTAQIAEPADD